MDFDIIYKNMAIESFTAPTVAEAKRYVQRRYSNRGAGCALSYFDSKTKALTKTVVRE